MGHVHIASPDDPSIPTDERGGASRKQRRTSVPGRRPWRWYFALPLLIAPIVLALSGPVPRLRSANATTPAPVAYLPLVRKPGSLAPTATSTVTPTRTPTASPTPTQTPDSANDLDGTVYFHPRYRTVPSSRPPHAFAVVLDVSTSMSWNFAGQGSDQGQVIQCTGGTLVCGPDVPWHVVSERRIYAAKQALSHLIDQLGPNDTMRLIVYSTNGITPTNSWSSDQAMLKGAVLAAGQFNGDPYRTAGDAPNASALYAARQALAQVPPTAPNGQQYAPVAIFLTDSVANQLLTVDGGWQAYSGADICPNHPKAGEIATCMAGYLSDGTPRPLTAMVLQGDLLKQLAMVYVVALGDLDETGLRLVSSAPNYPFFAAGVQAMDLDPILNGIVEDINLGDCIPRGGDTWSDTIDEGHIADGFPPFELSDTIVGFVYIYDQNGSPLPNGRGKAPIRRDPQTDKLSYHTADLVPGTYYLQAFVAYRGDDDISRIYKVLFDRNRLSLDNMQTFTIPQPPSNLTHPQDLYLEMQGSVCP
jgi:hypothetical protein